jgi:hypothetical protein
LCIIRRTVGSDPTRHVEERIGRMLVEELARRH